MFDMTTNFFFQIFFVLLKTWSFTANWACACTNCGMYFDKTELCSKKHCGKIFERRKKNCQEKDVWRNNAQSHIFTFKK